MITRRGLFLSALAAPFIVRAGSLMPVRAVLHSPLTWEFSPDARISLLAWQRQLYEEAMRQTKFAKFIMPHTARRQD